MRTPYLRRYQTQIVCSHIRKIWYVIIIFFLCPMRVCFSSLHYLHLAIFLCILIIFFSFSMVLAEVKNIFTLSVSNLSVFKICRFSRFHSIKINGQGDICIWVNLLRCHVLFWKYTSRSNMLTVFQLYSGCMNYYFLSLIKMYLHI